MTFRIIILLITLGFAAAKELTSKTLPAIELRDQFDTPHTIKFPSSKPIFLAIADREGSTGMNDWIEKSRQELGATVHYVGIADVRKVPSFLKSTIREKFKKTYQRPILLDWTGSVSASLNGKARVPNIYLISPQGTVLTFESGTFERGKLMTIKNLLHRQQPVRPHG